MKSILLSLAFHALLAAGIALYLDYAPAPDELARLDVTSVDLSFAETPDDSAVAALASVPPPTSHLPPPTPNLQPPTFHLPPPTSNLPLAPQPDTTDLPKPAETREEFAKVDAPPKPCQNIKPDYPRESRRRGEQGDVTLEIDVSAQGTVDAVRIVQSSGFPLLDEAAAQAAHAARFSPAKSEGQPVASTVRLTLNFKLK